MDKIKISELQHGDLVKLDKGVAKFGIDVDGIFFEYINRPKSDPDKFIFSLPDEPHISGINIADKLLAEKGFKTILDDCWQLRKDLKSHFCTCTYHPVGGWVQVSKLDKNTGTEETIRRRARYMHDIQHAANALGCDIFSFS